MDEGKGNKSSRGSWEDLVFGAIEKIATAAPGKLKDPKETVSTAFEWVKGVRSEVQEKIISEVSSRLTEIDWDSFRKKIGDHIAENFDINIKAKISLTPKAKTNKKSKADVD